MSPFEELGKVFVVFGILLVGVGLLFFLFPKLGSLPKLPGDIFIKKDNFVFYFPITTCILVSLLLTLLFSLLRR